MKNTQYLVVVLVLLSSCSKPKKLDYGLRYGQSAEDLTTIKFPHIGPYDAEKTGEPIQPFEPVRGTQEL
jgi:hypothetical protein